MAGLFDGAISYIEVPIASAGTTDISAGVAATASAFTLPFDAEMVGASVSAITGATSVAQVLEFNLCNGTTTNPIWTAATTVATVSTIRVDQGVVTVKTAAAHNLAAGQEITFTTANADTTGKLSAALLAALNKNQVVTSVPSTTTFTFGPLPQAAFYDNVTGFWKFTIAEVTPTTLGKLQLAEAPALTIGTTNNAYVSDLAGRPDKTYKLATQNLDGTDKYGSAAVVPAGTQIIPTYQTKSVAALAATAYNAAGNAPVNITLQVAVRKA